METKSKIFLRVTGKDVGFIKEEPINAPQAEKIPLNQHIIPSLTQGEIIEFIDRKETGWLFVRRCNDNFTDCTSKVEGYVDWRYVVIHCIELGEFSVTSPTVPQLTPKEIEIIVINIKKNFFFEFRLKSFIEIIINPVINPLIPPIEKVEVINIEKILKFLTGIANNNSTENFAEIIMRLQDIGLFQKIAAAINPKLAKKYPEASFRIFSMLYFQDLIQLLNDRIKDILWEERKNILRFDILSDFSPKIILSEIAKTYSELINFTPQDAEHRTSIYLRLKLQQMDYLLRKGGIEAIRTMIADFDQLLDAGIQLLFAEKAENPLLDILWGVDEAVVAWKILKKPVENVGVKIIQDKGVPIKAEKAPLISSFYEGINVGEGDFVGKLPVEEIDNETEKDNKKNVIPQVVDPCFPKEDKSLEQVISAAASQVHSFIFVKSHHQMRQYPHLIADINKVLTSDKPSYYKKLSRKVAVGFNETTTTEQLKEGKPKQKIANEMTWIDLVYIWFYNLGDSKKLGTKDNDLIFGKDAFTTKELIAHPALKDIRTYTKDRLKKSFKEEYKAFVDYNPELFFQAVKSNDVVLNFMGSFTVTVTPIDSGNRAKFLITNELGLESFTRFRRGVGPSGSLTNRAGILENVERLADPNSFIKIGGTLRVVWKWEQEL